MFNKSTTKHGGVLLALGKGINNEEVAFSHTFSNVLSVKILTGQNPYSLAAHKTHLSDVPTSGIIRSVIVLSWNATMRASAIHVIAH